MEIGTGSGFLTALLSFTADRVFSIERVRELSVRARAALDQLRIKNVALMVGDGTIGWRKYAPFDVIVVSAAAPSIPPAFIDQLGEGGRLLIPVGTRERQQLVLVRRADGEVHEEIVHGECTFVPLLGRFAWASELNEEAT
jgi:protein-L-isoaspartate(D-aspartate) O-methyltransferase